eukprot:83255-Pyramimonas_sp.AAC.1
MKQKALPWIYMIELVQHIRGSSCAESPLNLKRASTKMTKFEEPGGRTDARRQRQRGPRSRTSTGGWTVPYDQ